MKEDYKISELLSKKKELGYIFLGVGLLLFVMNISAFISYVSTVDYPYMWFNIAIFASIVITLFGVYWIFEGKK